MKITQVLKTQVFVDLAEIPNVPSGFRLTGTSIHHGMGSGPERLAIVLEGEVRLEE